VVEQLAEGDAGHGCLLVGLIFRPWR
jgi:hypothetical protein